MEQREAGFLVTGSTGFIGRRLVDDLARRFSARAVTSLVRPPATEMEAEALDHQRALGLALIEGDLGRSPVSGVPAPACRVIFHLAANVDTAAGEAEVRVNDLGTQRLLHWLGPNPPVRRIVYASSVAVHDRRRTPTAAISELDPCAPRTAYGRTKLLGEAAVRGFCSTTGNRFTILRLPTVYGPGQKADGLFGTLQRLIQRGDWRARLDWPGRSSIMHVDDVVDVMIDLSFRNEAEDETCLVASDESLSIDEIAASIARRLGYPRPVIHLPPAVWSSARRVLWSRALRGLSSDRRFVSLWRLSLMVGDGFWVDTTRFRSLYSRPLRTIEQGLADASPPVRRVTRPKATP